MITQMPFTRRAKVASICWGGLWCRSAEDITLWRGRIRLLYAVVCWGASRTDRDRKRLNKLVRRASSVLDSPQDIEVVGKRRMLAKLISGRTPLTRGTRLEALSRSFSSRLLHPPCKKEPYCRSFIPTAIRLFNSSTTWIITLHSLLSHSTPLTVFC